MENVQSGKFYWLFSKLRGDKVIWGVMIILSFFSVLAVYSSTGTLAYKYQHGNTEYYLIKHFTLMLFGWFMMYLAHRVDYRLYSRLAQILLYLSIPLLLYTLIFGADINNAKRWITLPVINLSFQTSDLAKLALIMYLARFLSKNQSNVHDFKQGFLPILITIVVVCALIAPADLSSSLVLFTTSLLILFLGRISFKFLAATIACGLIGMLLILSMAYAFPDIGRFSTWTSRIESFMDDSEESYQTQQAKIAVASGGILGKGPGNSTQRNFLPHPYSDFIYAIIFEEYGFAGGVLLMLLYLTFLYRAIRIVIKSPGTFGALLAVGLALALVIQAFMNMGVAVSLFPVTGLALPMVSMGGTSLWFTSIAIGIVLSVSRFVEEEVQPKKESQEFVNAERGM